jgi:hypothetical protein
MRDSSTVFAEFFVFFPDELRRFNRARQRQVAPAFSS